MKINFHEFFPNLGCPQKLCKTCKILGYSCFLCNCKYDHIKLNTGSTPFSSKKCKGREKTSNERKR